MSDRPPAAELLQNADGFLYRTGLTAPRVLPARGMIVVLAGSVRIEIEDGPTLDLSEGDMASMPKGAVTTWHPSPDFKELWVYS
jgi:hypothetical protein